jgi:hypothetical protein
VTERWRKKLEGIDQVGPADDVYERAKAGPTLPEAQSPMQRTSTRVATAIAAFVVFALAISLFVIPTLRLHESSNVLSAGGQLLPLWPARTVEQVQALQDDADAGRASWALDPQQVATRFGQAVMGWPDVLARPPISSGGCNVASGPYPSGSNAARAFAGLCPADYVPTAYPPPETCDPSMLLCGGTSSQPGSTSPSAGQSMTIQLLPCDPTVCGQAGFSETVEVFQPLGAGEGNVWSVLEVGSSSIELAVSPGQTVSAGSSVSTGLRIPGSQQFGFGVHVGASESCSLDKATDVYHGSMSADGLTPAAGSELATDLGTLSGTSCQQTEPGYVFVATSERTIVTGGVAIDPLQGAGGPGLLLTSFAAVPITFEWADGKVSSTASTPTTTTAWTTYTDPLGWTIDVPALWASQAINASSGPVSEVGAAFGSATLDTAPDELAPFAAGPGQVTLALVQRQGGPRQTLRDDSSLPLTFPRLDPVDGGYLLDLQADGAPFQLTISIGRDASTSDQLAILQGMVASIHFDPWQGCETRDGWASLCGLSDQTVKAKEAGIAWMALSTDLHASGFWVGVYVAGAGNGAVLGPVGSCGEGENETAELTPQTVWIAVECPDGSVQRWTKDGQPAASNTAPFDQPLAVHPVIRAWDTTLLTNRALIAG